VRNGGVVTGGSCRDLDSTAGTEFSINCCGRGARLRGASFNEDAVRRTEGWTREMDKDLWLTVAIFRVS